jgi:hypothetical protein
MGRHHADDPILAEFYGGPFDGQVSRLPGVRERWLIPVHQALVALKDRCPDCGFFHPVASQSAVYDHADLAVNSKGHHRYEFKGIR